MCVCLKAAETKCETQKVSVRSCWHVHVTAEVHLWDTAAVQDFFLKKCVN